MFIPHHYLLRSYASAAARVETAVIPDDMSSSVNYRKPPPAPYSRASTDRFQSFRWPLPRTPPYHTTFHPNSYANSKGLAAWPQYAGEGDELFRPEPLKTTGAPMHFPFAPMSMEATEPERRRASADATFGGLVERGAYGHGYYGYGCSRFGPYLGALLEACGRALGYGPQKTAQEIVGILEDMDWDATYDFLLKGRTYARVKAVASKQRRRIAKRCIRLLEYTHSHSFKIQLEALEILCELVQYPRVRITLQEVGAVQQMKAVVRLLRARGEILRYSRAEEQQLRSKIVDLLKSLRDTVKDG